MNRKIWVSTLAAGLLMTAAQGVGAGDFVQKSVTCPRANANIVGTPDGNINIEDIIVSSDAATDVTFKFVGEQGGRAFLRLYLSGNDTVVSNFQSQLNGDNNAAVKMSCGGTAEVQITLVGTGRIE